MRLALADPDALGACQCRARAQPERLRARPERVPAPKWAPGESAGLRLAEAWQAGRGSACASVEVSNDATYFGANGAGLTVHAEPAS